MNQDILDKVQFKMGILKLQLNSDCRLGFVAKFKDKTKEEIFGLEKWSL